MKNKTENEKEGIFWLDEFKGEAQSGYFIRNDLFKFFEKCKKQGLRIVGIKKPKPNDWNMEVLIENEKKNNENTN